MADVMLYVAVVSKPKSMRIAQKALDEVIGQDRLPTFTDQRRLAYIEACSARAGALATCGAK